MVLSIVIILMFGNLFMPRSWMVTICFAFAATVMTFQVSSKEPKKAFTTESSFSRTRLYDVIRYDDIDQAHPFLLTKDGSKVFIITGAGDSSKKSYKFQLLMYNTNDIVNYVRTDHREPPKPTVLFETMHDQSVNFSVFPTHRGGIRQLSLRNNDKHLYFLAANNAGIIQIYRSDLVTGRTVAITNASEHIGDYIVIEERGQAVYATAAVPAINSAHCAQPVYTPLDKFLLHNLCLPDNLTVTDVFKKNNQEGPPLNPVTLYSIGISSPSEPVRIAESLPLMTNLREIVFSPNRAKAIVRLRLDAAPKHIEQAYYKTRQFEKIAKRLEFTNDLSVNRPIYYFTYGLIDLNGGEIKYYPELPTEAFPDKKVVFWISDRLVYLADTEPLVEFSIVDDAARSRPALIDDRVEGGTVVDTVRHKYIRPRDTIVQNVISVASDNGQNVTSGIHFGKSGVTGQCPKTQHDDNEEDDRKRSCLVEISHMGIRLLTGERYDTPPNIIVEDVLNGKRKIIKELNPQFKDLAIGRTELLRVVGDDNEEWKLGLVLPPGFKKGRRYPLVVQTHGFDRDTFLIDGPPLLTAPYAAQAIASRGIIVLQVPNPYHSVESLFVDPIIARVIKFAIKELDQRGMVRVDKIGMTGYSARGRLAMRSAVFPDYALEAIVIADSVSFTPIFHALAYMGGQGGYTQVESEHCNTQPWGEGQAEWIKRQVFFQLDKMNSAVLFHEYNRYFPTWWDVIGGLRRLKKPVDAYTFQSGQHPPTKAEEVLLAQRQVVDWYDFWLNGKEVDDPSRAEQYQKWRELRRMKSNGRSFASPSLSTMDCPV